MRNEGVTIAIIVRRIININAGENFHGFETMLVDVVTFLYKTGIY